MKKYIVPILYYLIVIPFVLGFFFHKSENPQILVYSYKYFVFLCSITLVFVILIPYIFSWFKKKYGIRALYFSLIPTVVLLIILYLFFHYSYYANKHYHFDPYLQTHKPEIKIEDFQKDDFIILTLGGSTTRNSRLAFEDRYPTLLQKELQKLIPSQNVKVINAGMDWYTSKHSLINYVTYYRQIRPDVVIIMHAINDIHRSFSPPNFSIGGYKKDYSHFFGPSINAANSPTFERTLVDKFIKPYWLNTQPEEVDFELDKYKSIEAFRYNLKTLINYVIQDSSICLILEQKSIYKEKMTIEEEEKLWFGKLFCMDNDGNYASTLSLFRAMKYFNEEARNLAFQENVGFIEVGDKIQSNLDHFTDDVHYTKKGARVLAKIVTEYIINDKIFKAEQEINTAKTDDYLERQAK